MNRRSMPAVISALPSSLSAGFSAASASPMPAANSTTFSVSTTNGRRTPEEGEGVPSNALRLGPCDCTRRILRASAPQNPGFCPVRSYKYVSYRTDGCKSLKRRLRSASLCRGRRRARRRVWRGDWRHGWPTRLLLAANFAQGQPGIGGDDGEDG